MAESLRLTIIQSLLNTIAFIQQQNQNQKHVVLTVAEQQLKQCSKNLSSEDETLTLLASCANQTNPINDANCINFVVCYEKQRLIADAIPIMLNKQKSFLFKYLF